MTRGKDEWQLGVSWPTEVQHVQRRLAFRADVPTDHPMARARLRQGKTSTVSATVLDISLTGVGLQPPRQWVPDHDEPLTCEWQGTDTVVSLPLDVRHISRSASGTHLGARFEQPTTLNLGHLRRWVAELERYGLRKRQSAATP